VSDSESKPPATESFVVIDARYVDWPDVQFSEHAQRSNAQGLTIADRVHVAQRHARSDPFVSWWVELVNALVMDRDEAREELTARIATLERERDEAREVHQRLRAVVNAHADNCGDECTKDGHSDACMNCDPAAMLETAAARIATLERERDEARDDVEKVRRSVLTLETAQGVELRHLRERDCAAQLAIAERDSLIARDAVMTERIASLETALRAYVSAGIGQSTDHEAQHEAYRLAARALRGEGEKPDAA